MIDSGSSLDSVFAEDVTPFLTDAMARGERCALVTLVNIDGGAPRSLGAQMGVSESGAWSGYLSGGCVERAIVEEARLAIEAGVCRETRFGKGSQYLDIALPCGSAIDLYFDVRITPETISRVRERLAARQSCALQTDLDGGSARVAAIEGPTRREGAQFLRRYHPPLRLVIVGMGPVAICLARLAVASAIEVSVLSPDAPTRELAAPFVHSVGALAHPKQTPELSLDAWSALAVLFHDHDWEPSVLQAALASDAVYIGALGSQRTHALRLETLKAMGVSADQRARIRGPAGLAKRARSAPEIASSILAEILQDARAGITAMEKTDVR